MNLVVANVSKLVKNKNKNEIRIKMMPFFTPAVPLLWKIFVIRNFNEKRSELSVEIAR